MLCVAVDGFGDFQVGPKEVQVGSREFSLDSLWKEINWNHPIVIIIFVVTAIFIFFIIIKCCII